MNNKYDVTASIVTFKNDPSVLKETINSFIASKNISIKLYVLDNSPDDAIKTLCNNHLVEYKNTGINMGFGAAHNLILRDSDSMGKYHLVLNPDVFFAEDVVSNIFRFMEDHPNVGLLMPKILYPNGNMQYLCKLLPTPRDWIFRRFLSFLPSTKRRDELFELRFSGYEKTMKVPYLSGCFMFLRKSVVEEVGVFDEGIFMYGEDTDLTRRIFNHYDTLYYPEATIIHAFQKESHKSYKLLWIHVKAAIYYFNKWGWIIDKERKVINRDVINSIVNNNDLKV